MIASEKSHRNLSNYNQFLLQKLFKVNKKQIYILWEFMIMLACSSERIFNPMRYTGFILLDDTIDGTEIAMNEGIRTQGPPVHEHVSSIYSI